MEIFLTLFLLSAGVCMLTLTTVALGLGILTITSIIKEWKK